MGVRRFGLSLGTRIFLLIALLLALTVGAALAATVYLGETNAREAVAAALARAAAVGRRVEEQRQRQLTDLAAALSAPELNSALAAAAADGDGAAIVGLLAARQEAAGFDLAIVLDPAGRLLARTDRPGAGGEDLSSRPLVATALSRFRASGLWRHEGELYGAVAEPLQADFELLGFVIAGYRIDEVLARDLSEASGTEVALLALGPDRPEVVAASSRLARASGSLPGVLAAAGLGIEELARPGGRRVEIPLAGERWLAQATPLADGGAEALGATVVLASLDEALAPYRQIQGLILLAAAAALALALLFAVILSRRTLAPVRRLAAAAEAARAGDYEQAVGSRRRDPIGRLSRAFDGLLSELRAKRDLGAYAAEVARGRPDFRGAGPPPPPRSRPATLMAFELRRYARAATTADPEVSVGRLARELRRAAGAVTARRGRVESLLGHRLLASFEGEGRSRRALAAAAEIAAALGTPEDAFDEADPPLVALAGGEVVSGPVAVAEAPETALVGPAVQRLEGLLREAAPGELVLAREVYRELAGDFRAAGLDLPERRGITPLRFHSLDLEQAARLTAAGEGAAPAAAAGEPAAGLGPGVLLADRFELLSVLGRGRAGVVYKARDRELDDVVALRIFPAAGFADAEQRRRLEAELERARSILHPNLLHIYDSGELEDVLFVATEYTQGVTLRALLARRRPPPGIGLGLARQLAAGLGAAHAGGAWHRNVRPENLALEPSGTLRVMDLGAVPATWGAKPESWEGASPHYLAPERLEGAGGDARSDVFSTGVVLYEVFTGALPFAAGSAAETAERILAGEPTPPRSAWPEIPEAMAGAILTCLSRRPEDRYPAAGELLEALSGIAI